MTRYRCTNCGHQAIRRSLMFLSPLSQPSTCCSQQLLHSTSGTLQHARHQRVFCFTCRRRRQPAQSYCATRAANNVSILHDNTINNSNNNNNNNNNDGDDEQEDEDEEDKDQGKDIRLCCINKDYNNFYASNKTTQSHMAPSAANKTQPEDVGLSKRSSTSNTNNICSNNQATNLSSSTAQRTSKHIATNNRQHIYIKQQQKKQNTNRSPIHVCLSLLAIFAPGLADFNHYELPGDLFTDILGGLTVGVLQIPQAMAYATLAGTPPINGLYVSFVPVLVAACASNSRHFSYGTFAGASLLFRSVGDQMRANYVTTASPAPSSSSSLLSLSDDNLVENLVQQQSGANLHVNSAAGKIHDQSSSSLASLDVSPSDTTNTQQQQQETLLDKLNNLFKTVSQLDLLHRLLPTPSPSAPQPSPPTQIELLTTLALLVGIVQLLMAAMRLGSLSALFGAHLVTGFTTATAFHVITSQLDVLLDMPSQLSVGEQLPATTDTLSLYTQQHTNEPQSRLVLFKMFKQWINFVTRVPKFANLATGLLSAASIAYLLLVQRLLEPLLRKHYKKIPCIPSELSLMALAAFAANNLDLAQKFDIKIIGLVPTGLPTPTLPRLDFAQSLLIDSTLIAAVLFMLAVSMGMSVARKHKHPINGNRELFAMGSGNVLGSFFACFPMSVSLTRSALQSQLEPKSQLCSITASLVVLAVILYLAPILHHVPLATLAAIIVVSLAKVALNPNDFWLALNESKLDACVWLVTFSAVIALDMIDGLMIGLLTSLAVAFYRLIKTRVQHLERSPNDLNSFIEVSKNSSLVSKTSSPTLESVISGNDELICVETVSPRVKLLRISAALCYLNKVKVKRLIIKAAKQLNDETSLVLDDNEVKEQQADCCSSKILEFIASKCCSCFKAKQSTLDDQKTKVCCSCCCVLSSSNNNSNNNNIGTDKVIATNELYNHNHSKSANNEFEFVEVELGASSNANANAKAKPNSSTTQNQLQALIIDCSAIPFFDLDSVESLLDAMDFCESQHQVIVCLACCSKKLLMALKRIAQSTPAAAPSGVDEHRALRLAMLESQIFGSLQSAIEAIEAEQIALLRHNNFNNKLQAQQPIIKLPITHSNEASCCLCTCVACNSAKCLDGRQILLANDNHLQQRAATAPANLQLDEDTCMTKTISSNLTTQTQLEANLHS